ncbi:hypothetical protein CAPTEDRAFT_201809 [Capitella teleta]|uniref:Uncharacterized protein n=1 Tax=Capitella teleta TaxID=283909 RepID=R7U6E0_CAPTE|nr:hypothetical protein CAPTEDRAFT_201809 [Capitella teleta]|eukprot:ELU01549.1 hypothetical protein CAPTEDRAFT_201809 [Capitella teleta]
MVSEVGSRKMNTRTRPNMDWAVDARLPQRYKEWRRKVRNELRLSMAEDSDKTELWACTSVVVCSGEQGEDILQQAGMLCETNDHKKIFKVFDNFVTPSSHYIEDCIDYFYMKQGDLSISEFQSKAEKLIERVIPSYKASSTITHADVKQLLLRNLLLVGLSHRDMLRECQRLKNSDCTTRCPSIKSTADTPDVVTPGLRHLCTSWMQFECEDVCNNERYSCPAWSYTKFEVPFHEAITDFYLVLSGSSLSTEIRSYISLVWGNLIYTTPKGSE